MKQFISVLLAVMLVMFSFSVVYAEELPAENGNQTELTTTEPAAESTDNTNTEQNEEPTTEPASTAAPEEPNLSTTPSKLPAVRLSSDGKFKIKVYSKGKIEFADILKYVGKDNIKTFNLSTIDGYKIRQIRAKSFLGLKKLKNVKIEGWNFSSKGMTTVMTKAFYNCPNLKNFKINSFVELERAGVGYENGKASKSAKNLFFDDSVKTRYDISSKFAYALKTNFAPVYNVSSKINNIKAQIISDFVNGKSFTLKLNGKDSSKWQSSDPSVISVDKNGVATVLKKGKTTITIKSGKNTLTRSFRVDNDPYLTLNGKEVETVKIKNGASVTLNIKGKADSVENEYSESDKAEVTSQTDSDTIVIKGTMRGITTLTLTINGQPITIRVQVLKNAIPDSKMERIADSIGRQTNYYYGDSRVMCSAYSYAYCYRQILGITRTAGSFWCPGGCTWEGGTYTHYSTSKTMLKAIKKSIDKNESCVGLVSILGGSSQHYVTFYDYEDKGDQLSDFKILDPWDGNLTTGAGYGYSYGYHVVTVNS